MKEKGRKILNYIKFTKKELEKYVADTTSCIEKVNNTIHMGFPPYGMADFKNTLLDIINKKMIGFYEEKLNGIVLDAKNIKVLSTQWPIYNDSPELHMDINADFYVFKPKIGATITGMVNHVTKTHIGVIIYRVFNVSIRLTDGHQDDIENTEIKFTVKKFDLQNNLPYIEGILITSGGNKKKFDNSENDNENTDSGISTEITEEKKIKKFSCSSNDSNSDNDITHTQDKKSVSFNLSQNKFRSPSPFVKRERSSSESADEEEINKCISESTQKAKNSKKSSKSKLSTSLNNLFAETFDEKAEKEINKFIPESTKKPKNSKKKKSSKSNLSTSLSNLFAETFDKQTESSVKDSKKSKSKSIHRTPNVNNSISSVYSEIKQEKLSDTEKAKAKHTKSVHLNDYKLTNVLSNLKKEPYEDHERDSDSKGTKSKKRKAEDSLSDLNDSTTKKPKKKKRKSLLDDLSSSLIAEFN